MTTDNRKLTTLDPERREAVRDILRQLGEAVRTLRGNRSVIFEQVDRVLAERGGIDSEGLVDFVQYDECIYLSHREWAAFDRLCALLDLDPSQTTGARLRGLVRDAHDQASASGKAFSRGGDA